MVEKSSRDYYFDNAKFLLIILVVLGHFIQPVIGESVALYCLYKIIYIFHMPAFVFLTGYFMKHTKDHSKSIIKFSLLYLIMQTIYYFIMVDSNYISYSTPYWSYWYLLALVAWHLVFPHVKNIKGILAISFILGILVGHDSGFDTFLSLSRIFVFFPFILLGYFTKREHLVFLKNSKTKYIILAVSIICSYILLKYNLLDSELLFGRSSYVDMGYTTWYAGIYRLLAYSLSILYGFCFFIFVPTRQAYYSTLGRQTLNVYLMHGIVIRVLESVGFYNRFNTYPWYFLLIVISVILTFAFALISKIAGERKAEIVKHSGIGAIE
ncbi:hypothetical protein GC105_14460 [Alkalibaculum sp. M08DMB]|uniref:Acyltransferase 3 domain-containing protein n=1 Tax=Alkalibaculum sporogenes TaxID=2655001 RepID=A0A6A7KC29_9FIRM|nr:acyltransferase family protein [Alkalibaculum sporogenes]MPW26984.1 hypothetical protein [Alkalibaculum sporogenes]